MGLITHNNDVDITGYLSVSGNLSAGGDDLYVDTSTNKVGIGTAFPTSKLTVVGDIFCYDNIYADNIYTDNVYGNNIVYNTGDQTVSGVKSFLELKSLKTPVNIDDVVNRDYSNKNLVLVKDLTLQNHVFLDLGFPTGSPETGFKKISWILRQSSGNSYTVNYENVDWLTSSPTNPTETTPVFLETYPQSATGTKSYGIFLNPVADLEKIKSNIVYTTGDQVISGYKKFEEDVYIRNLYVTGSETIVSSTNTNVSSNYLLLNVTGGATDGGVFFVTGSGLTGVNDSGAIIGFDDFENFKFGIGSRSQDLNSLETIASTKFVNDSISGLSGFVFDIASTDYSLPNTLVRRSSLGYASFSFISADETNYSNPNTTKYEYGKITKIYGGSENPDSYSYAFPSKSGEIALDTTAVMLTGDQTVQGNKTISGILYDKNNNTIFDSTINSNIFLTDANATGYVQTGYNINLRITSYMNSGTGVVFLPTGGYGSDSLVRNGGLLRINANSLTRPVAIKQRVWTGSSYDPNLEQTLYTFSGSSLPLGTSLIFVSYDGVVWNPQRIAGNFYHSGLDPIDVTRINGVAVTGNQTISGAKTFSNNLTVNNGDLFVDTSNNRVGINTTSPTATLDVNGSGLFESGLFVDNITSISSNLNIRGIDTTGFSFGGSVIAQGGTGLIGGGTVALEGGSGVVVGGLINLIGGRVNAIPNGDINVQSPTINFNQSNLYSSNVVFYKTGSLEVADNIRISQDSISINNNLLITGNIPTVNGTGIVLDSQTGQFYANSNPSGFVVNSGGVASITRLTQSQYNSLTPNPTTLYIIIG
jgi:hypothetical protein